MTTAVTEKTPGTVAALPDHPDQADFLESKSRAVRALVNAERVLAAGFLVLVGTSLLWAGT